MIVEVLPAVGQQPVVLKAAQVLVRDDEHTPLCLAAEYGNPFTLYVSRAGEKDFEMLLRQFGYSGNVEVRVLDANR